MGTSQSKVQGLYLPAQSGKPRKMNDRMIYNKRASELFGAGEVNFIITSNNITLAEQTTRVDMELSTQFQDSDVYAWHSGKKTNCSEAELFVKILDGLETIVLCANAVRMALVCKVLARLEKSNDFNKKVNIWIDEADASIQLWKQHDYLLLYTKIIMVYLVSATFEIIFKQYDRIFIIGYAHTHSECYRCLRDCDKVEVDVVGTTLAYVEYVLDQYELVKPGVRIFAPGDSVKESHLAIATTLYEKGFVVVLINGSRKEILIPDKKAIDLRPYISSEEELSTTIAKLYHDNHWEQFPFAITCHNCIGRGITFQSLPANTHQGFLFTHGIFSPMTCAESAYQLMARVFGNIGNPSYVPCEVYSTHSMFVKVGKQEKAALELAKIIYQRQVQEDPVNDAPAPAEPVYSKRTETTLNLEVYLDCTRATIKKIMNRPCKEDFTFDLLSTPKSNENRLIVLKDKHRKMKTGELWQTVLGSYPGWSDLKQGHESGLDVMNPSRKIAMELKNRTNTDNASSRKANLDKLAAFKKKNPEYTCIYATLNDSTEQKTRDGSVKKFIHDGVELEQYVGYEVLTLVLGEDRDKVLECVRDTLYELD
uniref:Uncharacterized protein n=1 Tax=viral metagenome TaxID=1070528 RepID=A0A6C0AHA9_9ZZZZ